MALYTGRLRPKMVPFSGFGYIGTHSTDTRLIYNVYNGQFRLSQRKLLFFSLKSICLIQKPRSQIPKDKSLCLFTDIFLWKQNGLLKFYRLL